MADKVMNSNQPVDDDDVINQMKPLLAVLVDVKKPPSSPPVAVMPADDDNTPPLILLMVVWALINAVCFAAGDIATLILNRRSTPCTKSTWLFRCVALTKAAAAEATILLYGELLFSAAAALAAPLHMLLRTSTCRSRRWAAVAVDALAWVALAATASMHCMELASDRVFLAADPGDTYIFVDVVFGSVCIAADLLAGVLLCCSPRRLDQQDDHGEV